MTSRLSDIVDNSAFFETLYRKHSFLNVVSLILSVIGPLVCTILIGKKYGAAGLSAVAVCSPLFFLGAFLGTILSGGGNVLVSQAVARREDTEANRIYSATWILGVCGGVAIFSLLLLFEDQVMLFLSAGQRLDIMGYYRWMLVMAFLTILQWIPLNFCRLAGRPNVGPLMTGIMAVCTVAFALKFADTMGLAGVAFGQALACLCSLLIAVILMHGGLLRFRFTKRLRIRAILANGSPFGMERLYMMISIYIMNIIFHLSGGHIALAVYGVIQTLHRFMTAFISGAAQTILPVAGMLNAERDVVSLGKFLKHAAISGNVIVVAASVMLIAFRGHLAALFGLTGNADTALFRYAIVFYAAYAVILQNTTVFAAWFNASGRLKFANLLLFLQELFLLCLLAVLFGAFFGARTVWVSFPVSGALSILALVIILFVIRRRNKRLVYPFLLDPSAVLAGNDLSFSVSNDLADASKASERISVFCEDSGLTKKQTMLISLSVEEFIILIINNNDSASSLGISCRLTLGKDDITMRIRSRGRMFDPLAYYKEHISGDIERSVEVIGLKYIGENAKVIDYRETFGVNNLLITIGRN
ncbi:MAG: hypothetical protein LBO70_04090 [Clostridiales Family XIII bacterium]|jgi:Na+-driven multidrug efflux pump|nr:hypothetical protein [Clostridiales Family XIII bacterium]